METSTAESTTNTPKQVSPGWYKNLSNDEYHGSSGFSSSQLKTLIQKTPAHLIYQSDEEKKETPNMVLGSAVHCKVLEPEKFDEQFAVEAEVFDKRTKAGKAKAEAFKAASQGKTIVSKELDETATKMAQSVLSHPVAGIMLQDCVTESSVYWWYKSMDSDDDTQFKTMLKVRPDAISKNYPVIVDLKTTLDGSYTGFIRSIQNFYYHVSAAMYLEGVNQCKPLLDEMGHFAYTKFLFVCVENSPPFLTSIYELSPEYVEIGKLLYRRTLHTLKDAKANNWPGFPDEVRIIEPPTWANRGYIV